MTNSENKYNEEDHVQNEAIFGIKTYFWDYYKDNTTKDPFNYGYEYKDFYIKQKYDNLKHEVLSNKNGHRLDIKQYNRTYNKALSFMNTFYVRKVIKTENNFNNYGTKERIFNDQGICDKLYCDIEDNQKISVQHIIAIILYTDYIKLAYHFRNSFRKFCIDSFYETDKEFKERKREYWHWTKLMTECIEIYGEWSSASKYDTFYTGIYNKYIFNKFSANFICPISVTNELSVTSMYTNGYILELSCNTSSAVSLFVKYFDCTFLSSFAFENEYVFIGGCINGKSLNISSIRCIKDNINYSCFIRAINIFIKAINGQRIDLLNIKSKATKIDYLIIDKLIAHKISRFDINNKYNNKYPKYVNDIFASIINNQKCVKLSIYNIKSMYSKLKKYFISTTTNKKRNCNKNAIDLILYETIITLCPNCTEIVVEMSNSKNLVFQMELMILLSIITKINNFSRLQLIKLENIGNKCNEKDIKNIKNSFNKLNWDLIINKMDESKYKNKYQYVIFKKVKQNIATKIFKNIFISK